jgi:2'-5' RNA ligase
MCAKILQKYFIAIVPGGDVQERATELKMQLREDFNLKYALRSPAHVTLKMPFLWNEAKEDRLTDKLGDFFKEKPSFSLQFRKIGNFADRVIYIKVEEKKELFDLQQQLVEFCKVGLNLTQELSDYAYHPHMTVAFKDVKKKMFAEYLGFVKSQGFSARMEVREIALLKKEGARWAVVKFFLLGSSSLPERGDLGPNDTPDSKLSR